MSLIAKKNLIETKRENVEVEVDPSSGSSNFDSLLYLSFGNYAWFNTTTLGSNLNTSVKNTHYLRFMVKHLGATLFILR